jgi:hypothetical protein
MTARADRRQGRGRDRRADQALSSERAGGVRNLAAEEGSPTSRADMRIHQERTSLQWNLRFWKLSLRFSTQTSASSATELAGALVLIAAAGAAGAGVIAAIGYLVSGPGMVTLVASTTTFGTVFLSGLYLVTRDRKHGE